MAKTVSGTMTPELMGLCLLLSRLTAEIGLARTKSTPELADWVAAINNKVIADIDEFSLPGQDAAIVESVKDCAKGVVAFTLGRCSFPHNA